MYALKIFDENEEIKLKVVLNIKGADDISSVDSFMSVYEGILR